MASPVDAVRQTANRLNSSLMDFIVSLADENPTDDRRQTAPAKAPMPALREADDKAHRSSTPAPKPPQASEMDPDGRKEGEPSMPTPPPERTSTPIKSSVQLDYAAAVGALTLHFLNQHEATRVASLAWLIMLHRRAPRKVLATNDGTFPALLKTLSDPAEAVVTRDLQLLSQISKNSDDSYFNLFMTNLLQLFCTDRRLLETRCNLIVRQLCVSLSAERIYRTLADCLEKDEVRIPLRHPAPTDERTGSRICQYHDPELEQQSHDGSGACRPAETAEKSRKPRGPDLLCDLVSIVVPQRCCDLFALLAGTGLRTGLQSTPNLVLGHLQVYR